MKKILSFIFISFLFAGVVYAAPVSNLMRNVLPETTNRYDLGTSTAKWNNLFANFASTTALSSTSLCLTGDTCRTTWGSGFSTTSADFWITASTTIPKKTISNTWDGIQTFSNNPILDSLTGVIQGNAGTLYTVGTSTLTVSSPLTGSWTVLGSGGSAGIQAATASQGGYETQNEFNYVHSATTTFSSPLTYTGSTNAVTCLTCGVSNFGATSTNPFMATYFVSTSTTATSTFAGNAYIKGNFQVDGNFFAPVQIVSSGNATINGTLTVTGATTLATSLTGFLKGTSGLVSAVASIVPADFLLAKGNFLVGNDAGVAQATSTIFISSTGNVGIGTTTPDHKFSVAGDFETSYGIDYFGPYTLGQTLSIFKPTKGSTKFDFQDSAGNNFAMLDGSVGGLAIGNSYAVSFAPPTNGAIIQGNVGIGTTTPASGLDVYSTTGLHTLRLEGSQDPGLVLMNSAGGSTMRNWGMVSNYNVAGDLEFLYSANSTALPASTAMTLSGTGNVGIGTTSPATTLSVTGNGYLTGGLGLGIVNTTGGTITLGTSAARPKTFTSNTASSPYDDLTLTSNGSTGGWQGTVDLKASYSGGTPVLGLRVLANTDGTTANVGIGTTSPATKLDVNGTITQLTVKSCTLGLTTDALGSITGCVASDKSLKKSIIPLSLSLGTLLKLSPITYNWKDPKRDTQNHAGFVAQDVAKVFPQAVVSAGTGLKGVDSNAILSLVVNAMKDLYTQLQSLVARVSGLESKLQAQQVEIDALKARLNKAGL